MSPNPIARFGLSTIAAVATFSSASLARADHIQQPPAVDNSEYYYEYYATRCAKGSGIDAAIACQKAIDLRPDQVGLWTNLGVHLSDLGEYAEALNAYEAALNLDADYSLALVNRCADQIALNRFLEAIASCRAALDGDDRWGELAADFAWYNLGVAQEGLNRFNEAQISFLRALELNAENAAAWNGLGYALERAGRYEDAINAYTRAVAIAPNISLYRSNLELVQQRLRF